ncbi:MAG: TRZ/ATZ family hydrolase [Burkholderiales bacterium]|jgi:5-methylthioadenosine/S-adenosylhomocysteine deaminase|nr:TRZ/ATZ family hydrolase [Burkholderiales bacterium]
MTQFDQIIYPRWTLTINADNQVLENHAVAISDGKIARILPSEEARCLNANEKIELADHALLPGFVNLHTHVAMTLLRGFADDLPLMDWLNNHIWPVEKRWVSEAFVYDGTLLGMAEMLRGGVTTVNDMYYFPSAVARAGIDAGMRTFVGCVIAEFPSAYAQNAHEYLDKGLRAREQFEGEENIMFVLAPHAPYTVSEETFRKVAMLAEHEGMLVHCHIHETRDEIAQSMKTVGMRPLAYLKKTGLLSPRLTASHMVHLTDDEIALVAQQGVSVSHNPRSNMKLSSGIAPVAALLDAGVNIGIGTDGAASNNSLDILADMRLAALLAKVNGAPTAVSATTVLRMATVNGAKALGVGDRIGSIELGKQADLIAIDLSALETIPLFDPISQIVYSANREQVTHVWVNGECLMKERRLLKLDEQNLREMANAWQRKVIQS